MGSACGRGPHICRMLTHTGELPEVSCTVVPTLKGNLNPSPDLWSLKGPHWSPEKVTGKEKQGGEREKVGWPASPTYSSVQAPPPSTSGGNCIGNRVFKEVMKVK